MEEKGSDINLSVHLLNDLQKAKYDCAVLVTNDSDMAETIRLVKKGFYFKKIGLNTPRRRPTVELKRYADFTITIGDRDLAVAQFPNRIKSLTVSNIFKPQS